MVCHVRGWVTHLFFLHAFSVRECNLKLAAVTQPAVGMQAVGGLDYELYPFGFNLTVRVSDHGSILGWDLPSLFSETVVQVMVLNVNEAPVVPAGQNRSVAENSPAEVVLGSNISVWDPDNAVDGPQQQLQFSVTQLYPGSAFAPFRITNCAPELFLGKGFSLNFEELERTASTFFLLNVSQGSIEMYGAERFILTHLLAVVFLYFGCQVCAKDDDSLRPLTTCGIVNVTVEDVNDAPTVEDQVP